MNTLLPSVDSAASSSLWTLSSGEDSSFQSVPLGSSTAGHLEFRRGVTQLRIRSSDAISELFQARFRGPAPQLDASDGHVQIRYRHFSFFDWLRSGFDGDTGASFMLNGTIPWQLSIRGGLSELSADLRDIDLTSLRVSGGACDAEIALPKPSGVVPIRLVGGASNLVFSRPEGCAVRLRVTGGVSQLRVDTQVFGAIGGQADVVSPGFNHATDYYDVQITGGVSNITFETL